MNAMRCGALAVGLGVVLANPQAPAEKPVEPEAAREEVRLRFEKLKGTFLSHDLLGMQAVHLKDFTGLSPGQVNEIAVLAARRLGIAHLLKGVKFDDFHAFLRTDRPGVGQIRRQWGINMACAEILRQLSEKRLIADPSVIPHMIQALDHPARSFVGQKAFYALTYLTRRRSGRTYWARLPDDPKTRAAISKWWADWWARNRDKSPIFSVALEERLQKRVSEIARRIETQVKPRFPGELQEYSAEGIRYSHSQPAFNFIFDADMSLPLGALDDPPVPRPEPDTLLWLQVRARFVTPCLPPEVDQWAVRDVAPPARAAGGLKVLFESPVEGTDLVLQVRLFTPNRQLEKAVRTALAPLFRAKAPERGE